jgi:hypothetical protein
MAIGGGSFGLGHWGFSLLIVDPGGAKCTFLGYPTVRAHLSTKRWIVARRTPAGYLGGLASGQKIEPVTIGLYTVASFLVEGTNFAVRSPCPQITRVEIALPKWRVSANLPLDEPGCPVFEVHPVVYGPTGRQPPIP